MRVDARLSGFPSFALPLMLRRTFQKRAILSMLRQLPARGAADGPRPATRWRRPGRVEGAGRTQNDALAARSRPVGPGQFSCSLPAPVNNGGPMRDKVSPAGLGPAVEPRGCGGGSGSDLARNKHIYLMLLPVRCTTCSSNTSRCTGADRLQELQPRPESGAKPVGGAASL